MKPGEHPEFFRFPAPAGRSRESTIRLDKEGRFWHDGKLVEKESMRVAFARWIRQHPDDGRFILSNDYDWTYIQVEDVPFFIKSLRISDSGDAAQLTLSDGSSEEFAPAGLRVGPQGALYCLVKNGQFEARFTQGAQLALEGLLGEDDDGHIVLRLGESTFPIDLRSRDDSANTAP